MAKKKSTSVDPNRDNPLLDEIRNRRLDPKFTPSKLNPKGKAVYGLLLAIEADDNPLIAPLVEVRGKNKGGGDTRGEQQKEERKPVWEKWQREADRIKAKHPKWFKSDVTRAVHKLFPDASERTIRLHIKVGN